MSRRRLALALVVSLALVGAGALAWPRLLAPHDVDTTATTPRATHASAPASDEDASVLDPGGPLDSGPLADALGPATAHAQDAAMPWSEQAPVRRGDEVVVVALAASRASDGPLAAQRLAARRRALARAEALLVTWADASLARAHAPAAASDAVHAVLHAASERASRVRGRADGSVLLEVRCPSSALRRAFDHPACEWHEGSR